MTQYLGICFTIRHFYLFDTVWLSLFIFFMSFANVSFYHDFIGTWGCVIMGNVNVEFDCLMWTGINLSIYQSINHCHHQGVRIQFIFAFCIVYKFVIWRWFYSYFCDVLVFFLSRFRLCLRIDYYWIGFGIFRYFKIFYNYNFKVVF